MPNRGMPGGSGLWGNACRKQVLFAKTTNPPGTFSAPYIYCQWRSLPDPFLFNRVASCNVDVSSLRFSPLKNSIPYDKDLPALLVGVMLTAFC